MNPQIPAIPEPDDNVSLEPVTESPVPTEADNDVWSSTSDKPKMDRSQTKDTKDIKDIKDTTEIVFEPQTQETAAIADSDSQSDAKRELNQKAELSQSASQAVRSTRTTIGQMPHADVLQERQIAPTPLEETKSDLETFTEPAASTSADMNADSEPELFADSWLEEAVTQKNGGLDAASNGEIESLEAQKAQLESEIASLKAEKEQALQEQIAKAQAAMTRMIEEGTKELVERKTVLQVEIEKLERRQGRINQEMRRNFAGSSQELALRVQGFKDYLVGSLQDLASAADKLELGAKESSPSRTREPRTNRDRNRTAPRREEARGNRREMVGRREREPERARGDRSSRSNSDLGASNQFTEPTFAEQGRRIRKLLDQYRQSPDYYGSPWQLRRTFEASHAQRVQDWFFTQGGRGAIDSMGSRLQNILVASAAISVLHNLYGDRCRVLVLTDTPENLGEWRRGLQDCLGIPRSSFGANRGVVLFDSPEVLIQGAERLIRDKLLPVIVVDETEEMLNLSVLKFPLWLAFASTGKPTSSNYLY